VHFLPLYFFPLASKLSSLLIFFCCWHLSAPRKRMGPILQPNELSLLKDHKQSGPWKIIVPDS
jgi:hypothetical protein